MVTLFKQSTVIFSEIEDCIFTSRDRLGVCGVLGRDGKLRDSFGVCGPGDGVAIFTSIIEDSSGLNTLLSTY